MKAAKMHHVHARKQTRALHLGLAEFAALLLIFASLTASASAEGSADSQEQPIPPSALEQLAQGQGTMPSLTNPQAALQLPRRDLDRPEALNLMQAVFGPVLQSPAGPFDDLQVQRFLSDNVAVIAAGDQPPSAGVTVGETAGQAGYKGPTLIESTLPLRANGDSPADVVDLGLERTEDELQPANPLAEVGIPQELGEGIDIPDAGIEVELVGVSEDRTPSIIDQSVAAYPDVARDTSFVVAPTPTGFETMSILQSAEAPTSQTFHLHLPQGAELEETFDGGAIVTREGETLLEVGNPAAIDAAGSGVPTALHVSGDTLTVEASPDSSDQLPILVDPTFSYDWYGGHTTFSFEDWSSESNNAGLVIGTKGICVSCGVEIAGRSGLDVFAKNGAALVSGSNGTWSYYVPRYFTDQEQFGAPPQSFITGMTLQDVAFYNHGHAPFSYAPAWVSGIWDQIGSKYTSQLTHGGNEGNVTNLATTYTFGYGGDQNAKRAVAAQLYSGESKTLGAERELYVGNVMIELGDSGAPSFGSPTPTIEGWVNNKPTSPVNFTASDAGLGVQMIWVHEVGVTDMHKGWGTSISCSSTPSSPCPRTWKSSEAGRPVVTYDPSTLPQGEDTLEINALDPAGNKSAGVKTKIKVDHTAPSVALSGNMTEQATIGVSRPRYILTTSNTDGTEAAPQSGVVSTEITVDGKKVDSTSAGCATKNCSVSRGWALESAAYSVGKHVVVAKATDGVGLTTEKTLNIEIQRDTTKPTIENFGTLYDAPDGWVEQETYEFGINAWDKGYGVTALEFKMDSKVVASANTPCPNGGCTEWLNVAINMADYEGGAHTAEIVAKDGASNVTAEAWTVNVDPNGEISTAEAITTLKAFEATGESYPIAPTSTVVDAGELAEGNDPGVALVGEEMQSVGTATETSFTVDPADGATISTPDGLLNIQPTLTSPTATIETVGEDAALAANTSTNVDTVVRPIFDGVMTYQTIRDATAPEDYSWEVALHKGQILTAVDSLNATINNEDGSEALLIRAEPSRDATGKEIATELIVSEGNVLTLVVKHQTAGVVYPVVAGPAFEAGYVDPVIYTPPPPPPPPNNEEEEEQRSVENSVIYVSVGAPEPVGKGDENDATASSVPTYRKFWKFDQCEEHTWPIPGCSVWDQEIKGHFYYNYRYAWWKKEQPGPQCPHSTGPGFDIDTESCGWAGPNHQKYGGGYHITAQVFFDVTLLAKPLSYSHIMTIRMFGSGGVYAHKDEPCICNPST